MENKKLDLPESLMMLGDLTPGDKVTILGMEMELLEWQNQTPVFYHEVNGVQVNYCDKSYNKKTLLNQIR